MHGAPAPSCWFTPSGQPPQRLTVLGIYFSGPSLVGPVPFWGSGALDVEIATRKDAAGIVTATVAVAKDMADGISNASRLEVMEIGPDEDGDTLTSCVIVPTDDLAQATKPRALRLTETHALALRAWQDADDTPKFINVGASFRVSIRSRQLIDTMRLLPAAFRERRPWPSIGRGLVT